VVAVVLKTTDAGAVLAVDLAERVADAPGFFDFDPVLIDLAPACARPQEPIDFAAIAEQLLRQQRTLACGCARWQPMPRWKPPAPQAWPLLPTPRTGPCRSTCPAWKCVRSK
jgi:septum site-determining protein MinC